MRKEEVMVQKKAEKKVVKKGDVYKCGVCGLAVVLSRILCEIFIEGEIGANLPNWI